MTGPPDGYDEAGFQSDPPLGRTYGLKGQTPVLSTSGQRQSINAISAVNGLNVTLCGYVAGTATAPRREHTRRRAESGPV